MPNCVYLDKDSLIVLSKQIFVVANQEYNRSSDFFEENIRNYEYDAIMEVAREALEYNDTVFINSPFTREVRTPGYMELYSLLRSIPASRIEKAEVMSQRVRDWFLFATFTGVSYADLKRLSEKDITQSDDGTYWIHIRRQMPFSLFIQVKHNGSATGLLRMFLH